MSLNESPWPSGTRSTYNHCQICGHRPGSSTSMPSWPEEHEEPDRANMTPLRWWDPDDGWKIGTLCLDCWDEVSIRKPEEGDYAFELTNGVCDKADTEVDYQHILEDVAKES